MGMFDHIEGTTMCIHCEHELSYYNQTKSFYSGMDTYSIGDEFPYYGTKFHEHSVVDITCSHCKRKESYGMVTVNDIFTHVVEKSVGEKINRELEGKTETITITFSKKELTSDLSLCLHKLEKIKDRLENEQLSSYDVTGFTEKIEGIINDSI